jgi:hypothetical protein
LLRKNTLLILEEGKPDRSLILCLWIEGFEEIEVEMEINIKMRKFMEIHFRKWIEKNKCIFAGRG